MFASVYSLIISYASPLLAGLGQTCMLWLAAMTISVSVGTCLGILNCARFQQPWLATVINAYVFIARGIPLYVQILIAYFVLPSILNINLSPAFASILALGLCSGAYITEIVRCGINAIAPGQWEASAVLGYSSWLATWYIILPQMIRNILPALANELDAGLKSTALFSAIGVMEITKVGTNIVARFMNPVPVYCIIATLYLVLSYTLMRFARTLEERIRYDQR